MRMVREEQEAMSVAERRESKVEKEGQEERRRVIKNISGGVKRVKDHLACNHKEVAICRKVPDDVKNEIQVYLSAFTDNKHKKQRNYKEMVDSGSYSKVAMLLLGVRGPMDRYMVSDKDGQIPPPKPKKHRNQVCLDIGRFFYENAIPFHAATSASFVSMVQSIGNYGRGLKPPSMHELRNWKLDEEKKTTEKIVDEIKETWKKTGVSILSDGWSDMRNRSLINFLVNNQYGTIFLRTVDASDCVKDAQKLFELLDDVVRDGNQIIDGLPSLAVVEEVGEEHVIQLVIDNAANYKAAGKKLMEKQTQLYWTPCAVHYIDLMLEKIGELPQHKNALLKAKKVSNFIYNHQWVLALFRKMAGKDLLRPAATRFATAYLTLESMLELKQPLQTMFVSREWQGCAWAKKADGKELKKIVMNDNTFWPSVVYSIKTTKPLVEVLRIVYGAMDEAKEKIAMNFEGKASSYKEIWARYRWSPNVSTHSEIKSGLYKCLDRLVPNQNTYSKIDMQLDEYNHKKGLFGIRASLASYMTRPPVAWWDNFGDDVPELKAFAIRILGLTCSASACECNWSMFNHVHTKKRNRLTTTRLNNLVYIMYNRKLKYKYMMIQQRKDDVDPLVVEEPASDDEWVANPSQLEEDESPLTIQAVESSSRQRKRKQRGGNLGLIDEDEEDEYDGDGDEDKDVSHFLDI
ncbi:uncharacterized protein LOC131006061 [Salvia miltiorrhiza]|uniref:uncharacterized protein LOC131006061 n=1 Tax=Salvia miltiorrhiza TaxID=226208 RepID=UPI0025AC6DA3|nr:uncharacterized protein LOC131006061 [Salvia miltiorrhiza]